MHDKISDEEKLKLADDALRTFFDQLGPNDIYKKVLLEVLFEEMFGHPVDLSDVADWELPPEPTSPEK